MTALNKVRALQNRTLRYNNPQTMFNLGMVHEKAGNVKEVPGWTRPTSLDVRF